MKKIFKATLAVLVVAAAGGVAYRAYGAYVAANMSEDDLLLTENVEALASIGEGLLDANTAWFSILTSGKCAREVAYYNVTWEVDGAQYSAYVHIVNGKALAAAGTEFHYPNCTYQETLAGTDYIDEGDWSVCKRGATESCDRCLQFLCNGTKDCYHNLAVPTNARPANK